MVAEIIETCRSCQAGNNYEKVIKEFYERESFIGILLMVVTVAALLLKKLSPVGVLQPLSTYGCCHPVWGAEDCQAALALDKLF